MGEGGFIETNSQDQHSSPREGSSASGLSLLMLFEGESTLSVGMVKGEYPFSLSVRMLWKLLGLHASLTCPSSITLVGEAEQGHEVTKEPGSA